MDRRRFLITSMGAAAGVVVVGCSDDGDTQTDTGGGEQGGEVSRATLRLAGEDAGFPSPFGYSRGNVHPFYIYDTLLWKDSTGELLPWLATGYEASDDGTTYTFELRDDVTWHDGQPLTAEDVAFTFRYFAEKNPPPTIIFQPVPDITEVIATNERTVEFRLANPVATFLQFGAAGAVPIIPQHIWSSIDDPIMATDLEVLVGTGPYQLQSYTPGEGAYLYTAYEDYFLGTPFVERIEYTPVGDSLASLLAGDLDKADTSGVRPEVLAPFRNDDAFEVLTAPPGSVQTALHWNLAKGGALADPLFRQACSRAIDRNDLVERLFGGNGTPGNPGWIPPENPFHNPDVNQYPFDPAAAGQMLDEAGYTRGGLDDIRQGPDGAPLRFSLLLSAPSPAVELVVQALRAVGVELTPQTVDRPTFNQRVLAGDVEMSFISSGGISSDLAPDYLRLVYSSQTKLAQHAQGYVNPEVDRLCADQLAALDLQERMEIVARIQELVASDVPLLPLFYPDAFSIHNKSSFDEWYYTPGGVAGVVPVVENKQVFITGAPEGTEVRPTSD